MNSLEAWGNLTKRPDSLKPAPRKKDEKPRSRSQLLWTDSDSLVRGYLCDVKNRRFHRQKFRLNDSLTNQHCEIPITNLITKKSNIL